MSRQARLNQLIALDKTVKAEANQAFTGAYHTVQKTPLFAGITRTYQPRDDAGEKLPGEGSRVQVTVPDVIKNARAAMERLMDLTATKDRTNQDARADIKIGETVIAEGVPVSTLLFLEKQLVDLATFVKKMPLLDPAEQWSPSDQAGVWVTDPKITARSKKVPRNHVKAKATDKHPEQVELYHEDVVVGDWTTKILSGNIPAKQAQAYLERITALTQAVKIAREEANLTAVTDLKIGPSIVGYVFD